MKKVEWISLGDLKPKEKVDVDISFKDCKVWITKGDALEATAMEDIQKGDLVVVKCVGKKLQARKWRPKKK